VQPGGDHGERRVHARQRVGLENPALEPLTDIFAIPASLPLANVFSIGDVLIGVGIVIVIAAAMRRPPETPAADVPPLV
jgi:hypothetical protein